MNLFQTLWDLNKFIRDLTVKKHFFTEESDWSEYKTVKQKDDDFNERGADIFSLHTYFLEQIAINTLNELKEEGQFTNFNNASQTQIGTTIGWGHIPNPNFYPIQSRSMTMDMFQTTVER